MSHRMGSRPSDWPGFGAFCIGLALIISATVMNLASTRMPTEDLESLPILGLLYQLSGKLGVTITLISLGLLVVVLAARRRPRQSRRESSDPSLVSPPFSSAPPTVPYLYTADETTEQPRVRGRMVLETRKYFPATALSGPTGWDATKRKPSE